MKLLLDTIAFDSLVRGTRQIPDATIRLIQQPATELFVSVVSIWELSIQASYGRIVLAVPFGEFVRVALKTYRVKLLPVTQKDVFFQSTMAYQSFSGKRHTDPFDRLIISQASVRKLPVVSSDQLFSAYPIQVIWK